MRKSRVGIAAGVLLLGAAVFLWPSKQVRPPELAQQEIPASQPRVAPPKTAAPSNQASSSLLAEAVAKHVPSAPKTYRLSNTTRPKAELDRDHNVVSLRNAVIDTTSRQPLDIPESLKAKDDPGSYIVRAREGLNQSFYDSLRAAGADFVAYVPNDAALVKATKQAAAQLQASWSVESVLPYEPYYKLDPSLLPAALGTGKFQSGVLTVTSFPNGRDALLSRLAALNLNPIGEDRTPFGTSFIVNGSASQLIALAQDTEVQEIEPSTRRALLNDLTRPKIGVAVDSTTETNYMQLTGQNVIVAINDSGVDAAHPALLNRVFAAPGAPTWLLTDGDPNDYGVGHGTHVAGIIAGDGSKSDTPTNVLGSLMGTNGKYAATQFRGMAPKAKLFVQPVDLVTGPLVSDSYLQESASKSNALICNNSWAYVGIYSYNMSAASYDAATRDAQPGVIGSQPLLFVFAAGNEGGGSDDGTGGITDSILSPATAKNVITVGALESARNISNEVHIVDGTNITTNLWWSKQTDSDFQVANFSSRGNVGIGIEGMNGRFKPDVVAPGVFVASTRSTNWQNPTAGATVESVIFRDQISNPNTNNVNSVIVPNSGIAMLVQVFPNAVSPVPFPTNLVVSAGTNLAQLQTVTGEFPVAPGTWYVSVANPNPQPVSYDVGVYILVTNAYGDLYDVLKGINDGLQPYYRFESGTSMAAPAVSGTLALIQEYLATTLQITNPSPALMKAMLINGAHTTAGFYDYEVAKFSENDEGWGLINITNSIPTNSARMLIFDQSPTNALATGESFSRTIKIADDATNAPLRVTLVWTDPPGNPAVGIKLVNDLDLVVSNTATHEIYVGNDFIPRTIYTRGSSNTVDSAATNAIASDIVNNVENVYITGSSDYGLSTEYVVTVKAKRVNVNAVTAHTNAIVQDYALVISSASITSSIPITLTATNFQTNPNPWLSTLTNGVPVLYQRVGANSPLLGGTNGTDVQWRFYVFTNAPGPTNLDGTTNLHGGPYVAILTFMSPDLSTPRNFDADIDLYVSTDPALTNLDPVVVSQADKSLLRGGTELVTYTNSHLGAVYYVAVKSEDQKAAEFGLLAMADNQPFSDESDGIIRARAAQLPLNLPDGTPLNPRRSLLVAVSVDQLGRTVRRVGVRERILHQHTGDIYAKLTRGASSDRGVWLNNHSNLGTNSVIFDDTGETLNSIYTDGPGSLQKFVSTPVTGPWITTIWDNAAADAGQVTEFSMLIAPRPYDPYDFNVTIRGHGWYHDYLDLPTDVTNLNISIVYNSGTGPVDIYLRKADYPNQTNYDHAALNIAPPGGALNVSSSDTPPINGGRWYYGLYNQSPNEVNLHVVIRVSRAMIPDLIKTYYQTNVLGLLDDARTQSTLFVPESNPVLGTSVGVRLNHDRASDLAITLTSPQGTRVMLFEDRGGTSSSGLGLSVTNSLGLTNYVYTMFTENTNWADQLIKFAVPPYGSTAGVLATNLTVFFSDFETNRAWDYTTNNWSTNLTNMVLPLSSLRGTYTNGEYLDGWFVVSNIPGFTTVITNNATNIVSTNFAITNAVAIVRDTNNANTGTNFLALGNGRLLRVETTIPGRPYILKYAYKGQGLNHWWPEDGKANDLIGQANGQIQGLVTYTNGVVFQNGEFLPAWTFSGDGSYVDLGANTGNFGTNDFTIEHWIKRTPGVVSEGVIDKRSVCNLGNFWGVRTTGGFPDTNLDGSIGIELCDDTDTSPTLALGITHVNDSQWHHVAYTRKGQYVMVYIDGAYNGCALAPHVQNLTNNITTKVGVSACDGVDGSAPLLGQVDELSFYNRALSPAEINAIYQAGSNGKYTPSSPSTFAQVVIGGVTNFIDGNTTVWKTNTIAFIARTNQTAIELIGSTMSPLLDTIKLEEMANTNYANYYFAEESLDSFKGENSFGNWTLNLWDVRTGMASTNNSILSWELQLTYSSTNVAIVTLTNRVEYTNTIAGTNGIAYFAIDVPEMATMATNSLWSLNPGDPLNLIYNQTALPTPDLALPGDALLLANVGPAGGVRTLNLTSLPLLVPGQRYFLAVSNPNTLPQDFRIRVDFDVTTNVDATVLTNGTVISTNNIANASSASALRASYAGTSTNGQIVATNIQYFAFDISPEATMATFEVFDMTNDLDLVVSKGLPLPSRTNFDYIATSPGTNNEIIAITTNSLPVPLSAGRWYMGVYSYTGTNVTTYKVRATEYVATLITLTNGIPYTNFVSSNYSRFFAVDVPANALAVTNFLETTNHQLNLYYSTTGLPVTNSPLLLTANSRATYVLSTNSTQALVPGQRYYLWVAQTNYAAQQPFTIRVDFSQPPVPMTTLTNGIAITNGLDVGAAKYYVFNVSSNNPVRLQFDVYNLTADVSLFARRSLPVPDKTNFETNSENIGVAEEQILVTNTAMLTPGLWYLCVTNIDTTPASYVIRASEWDWDTNTVVLNNGIAYQGTVASNSIAYFAVDVPNGVDAATNTLTSIDHAQLDLLFSQIPEPIGVLPGDFTLLSTTGTGSSVLAAFPRPETLPPLVPGARYYLGVSNTNGSNVQFSIVVNLEAGITTLTDGVAYTNGLFVNSGMQYYKYTVSSNAAMVLFEVPWMTDNVDLVAQYNTPLAGPLSHDYASANPGTNAELIVVLPGTSPAPLKAGPWYLGVFQPAGQPASYTVRATEWGGGGTPTTIGNNVTISSNIPPRSLSYFKVFVPTNAMAVHNHLIASGSPLDLFFNQSTQPTGLAGDVAWAIGATDFTKVLDDGSTPPLVKGATYYLTVRNSTDTAQPFSLSVSMDMLIILSNAIGYTNTITVAGSMQYYGFEVASSASEAAFEILNPTGNADLVLKRGLPVPTPTNKLISSTRPGTNFESIILTADNPFPVLLTPGWWYATVYTPRQTLPSPVTYTIRAIQETNAAGATIVPLTHGVPYSSIAAPGASFFTNNEFIYYRFTVPDEMAVMPRLVFSVTNATGVPTLLVSPADLGLPTLQSVLVASKDATNGFASVTIQADMLWHSVDWYVAVPNWSAANMSFDIVANMYADTVAQVVDLENAVPQIGRQVMPFGNFNEFNIPILYRFVVTNNDAAVIFNIANASGEVDLYARLDGYPTTDVFSYASTNLAPLTDAILIATNDTLPSLNGEWFLMVNNPTDAYATYDIMATLLTPLSAFIPTMTIQSADSSGFSFVSPTYPGMEYQLEMTTNLNYPFTPLNPSLVAVGTNYSFRDLTPVNGTPQRYYRLKLLGIPGSGQLPPTLP